MNQLDSPLLELRGIDKSFFGVPVLEQVWLQVQHGQTLGVLGENGAGKSTLMNILGGNLSLDAGDMLLDGTPYAPRSPRDADEAGVAFIHQELNVFPNLTIEENLFLSRLPRRLFWINRRVLRRQSIELLSRVGLNVSPTVLVEDLSAGERQLVEIAKALSLDARLIILDEPTTSLTVQETRRLFDLLRSLHERGISMIYISHTLKDVQELCQSVAVLRDGRVVGSGPTSDFDINRMVTLMVGRETNQQFPDRTRVTSDDCVLAVNEVSQPRIVHNISFSLRRNEVLGISGLMGSGRTELARILFGLDPLAAGTIELDGQPVHHLPPRDRIRLGMAFLTESRRDNGLFMQASVQENSGVVAARQFASQPFHFLKLRNLNGATHRALQSVKLDKSVTHQQSVQTLSGGNQQKVVLAKWLLIQPQVLILDEPTRGIDVGARYEIYRMIDQLASSGAGVLIISSEIDELIGLCDRILVMSQGEIRDELSREEFDSERILLASLRAPPAQNNA